MVKNFFKKLFLQENHDLFINHEKINEKSIEELTLEMFIGKKLIIISNEIENVCVGIGLRIEYITKAQNPVLIAYDVVQKKEIMVFSHTELFSEQKFKAYNLMDHDDRIVITYGKYLDESSFKQPRPGTKIYSVGAWQVLVEEGIKAAIANGIYTPINKE